MPADVSVKLYVPTLADVVVPRPLVIVRVSEFTVPVIPVISDAEILVVPLYWREPTISTAFGLITKL